MRNLVYYVACTVDRFIARADGSFDFFLAEGRHLDDLVENFPDTIPGHLRDGLGVRGGNTQFGAVLMGRRTYEVGLDLGVTSPYPHLKQYLFSQSMASSPDPDVELVSGDAAERVRALKAEEGRDIWLCGGGDLASVLFDEIDELILKVNPVVLGSGIPLFARPVGQAALDLHECTAYDNGFVLMRYHVRR